MTISSNKHKKDTTKQSVSSPTNDQPQTKDSRAKSRPIKKQRLDTLLVERALVTSREQAKRLIMAGEVLVDETIHDKPGMQIPIEATIRIRKSLPYVSRGGLKLEAALIAFSLDVTGLTVLDVGASTGGFTDCLLQRGAANVYAIDVGYGQLAWKLRNDPRVITMERTNIRYLDQLPGGALGDLAVIDASFISLALVLPATLPLLTVSGQVVALIKPQFEAGKEHVGKGGVVRKQSVHRAVLEENRRLAEALDLTIAGMALSPLLGPAGNVEFLVWYQRQELSPSPIDTAVAIEDVLRQAETLRRSSSGRKKVSRL